VSEYIARECRKKGANPKRIKVIYSARDIPEFNSNLLKENAVLFCGFLEPRKDPMTFLKSIKQLSESYPDIENIKFLIIGDGFLKTDMLDFCRNNKLEKHINFTGELPLQNVWDLMNMSKVLVLPSIREPSGAVLTEAMAHRCYCIASKVGGIPELVTDNRGSTFEPGNYKELAELISDYFNNENIYMHKIENAYKYVKENYSFKKAAQQLEEIFKFIVSRESKVGSGQM
jgi:glycosyltransferase involved in cell wall biosynthesis